MKNQGKATVEIQGVGWDKKFVNVDVQFGNNRVEIKTDKSETYFGELIKTKTLNFPASMCVILWEDE